MEKQRNLIWAVVLMGIILIGWDLGLRYFYPHAGEHPHAAASSTATSASGTAPASGDAAPAKPTREGGLQSPADIAIEAQDLKTALAAPTRVAIAAPGVSGSINLVGGLIDDLTLNRHRETSDAGSPPVRLFSPAGTPAQHYAQLGWTGDNGVQTPQGNTVWQADRTRLTPTTPVTLRWTNATGQTFAIRYAIDENYMISAQQSVTNAGTAPVSVKPFALINRTDRTASLDTWQVHSGPIGAFDGSVDFASHYKDVNAAGEVAPAGQTNWIGFTDIYWLSALVPDAGTKPSGSFRALGNGFFRADLIYPAATVAPGQTVSQSLRLFAGAKENRVLEAYEAQGISNFSLAIDWGWFRWFEKPIFWLLDSLFHAVKNFGIAIILLTLIVRGIMFPVAQRQFASMAAMRAIQPKMKAIQERYKDDKPRQQQEIMALYKEEGVNPLAGCLPMFLQIPVFFALYKVLVLTIEMRHQPFALWIHDLSSPDPTHLLNLFGLLPFTPTGMFGIGVLALLLGATMWLQFKLQPAAMDPSQQQVMAIMPWMMMFVMSTFASGLLIYWITSNLLTIAQQRYLYSRHPQLKAQATKDQVDIDRQVKRERKPAPNRPKKR
ncbi:putative inner membrane protein translocase component YidC [Novosphingobium nitrogenifigens DSM 19370]|uniref:Membrane protein insertase YidC n=1 Tax=Novosphingobium nitrogenifigens DSM 19370 TaxID=983920 RepID=F1Z640_9SPHN|nr:membrane protein insertase YidC [Novosphingobium nitrogenifigens]EGD59821.1 putative inner membrane protein translocase component YidC [Novosphingobium nitrogenifigens DSM 19370]